MSHRKKVLLKVIILGDSGYAKFVSSRRLSATPVDFCGLRSGDVPTQIHACFQPL